MSNTDGGARRGAPATTDVVADVSNLLYLLDELEYVRRGTVNAQRCRAARVFLGRLAEGHPLPQHPRHYDAPRAHHGDGDEPLFADSTPAPVFRPPARDELPQHRGEGSEHAWPYGECDDAECWCKDARGAVDQLLLGLRARDARRASGSDTPPPYDA